MKKFALFAISLCILVLSAPMVMADSPRVILDQLLTGPTPALNARDLNIPPDLAPGFHQLTVEVYNESGVVSTETALFCKNLLGELHFDNICPDLLVKKVKPAPKRFDPLNKPEETLNFLATAFGILSAVFIFRRRNKLDTPPDLPGIGAGDFGTGYVYKAWGDRRWYINLKVMTFLDEAPKAMAKQAEKVFSLLARMIVDARYLRAIFGNLSWLTIPASIVMTYLGLHHHGNRAIPFDKYTLLVVMLIGVFDALAGFIGALVYIDFVFANGHLNDLNAILFTAGFTLLFFMPALLASKIRPLHRTIKGVHLFWERLVDYALISLLTGWAASKAVQALPSLYGYDLPITKFANKIGIYVGLAIAVRLLLEEIAWYGFPYRLAKLHIELKSPGYIQEFRGLLIRLGLFILFLYPYVGWNKYLYIGIGLFAFPQLLSLISWEPPKSKILGLLPKGALRIVLVGIGALLIQRYAFPKHFTPRQSIINSIMFLPIPAAVLSLLDFFAAKSPFNKKSSGWRHLYRLLGIIVLILLIMQVLGLNPIDEIHKAWQHPHETWHSLTYKWWRKNPWS